MPLPAQRDEIAHFKTVKAHIDYQVEVERHRYSVSRALVRRELTAWVTATGVGILHRGQRVACHVRSSRQGGGGFTTAEANMPAAHRAHMESTPQRLISTGARALAPAAAEVVSRLLAENRHPEHGFRASLGLLSLAKPYSKAQLETGCTLALQIGTCRCRHVRDILANNRDQTTPPTSAADWVSPDHAHLRGPGYYQ